LLPTTFFSKIGFQFKYFGKYSNNFEILPEILLIFYYNSVQQIF